MELKANSDHILLHRELDSTKKFQYQLFLLTPQLQANKLHDTEYVLLAVPLPSWKVCVFSDEPLATGPSSGLGVQSESGRWWTFDTESRRLRRQPSCFGLGKAWGWRLFPIFLAGWKEHRVRFSPRGSS